jgi:hypothetical protein
VVKEQAKEGKKIGKAGKRQRQEANFPFWATFQH